MKYTIYSVGSKNDIGCALMQESKVVAYTSRQLKPYERSYPTHALELAAMVCIENMKYYYLYMKYHVTSTLIIKV